MDGYLKFDTNEIATSCFGCNPEDLSSKVLISPILRLSKVKELFASVQLEFSQSYGWSGFTGIYQGQRISVINSGQGPTRVGDLVLALGILGVEEILFIGSVGVLDENYDIGDIFLADHSIDGEGFSRYWSELADIDNISLSMKASNNMLVCAEQLLKSSSSKYLKSTVFSIGSLFAETRALLDQLKGQGVSAIDQEISAVYTASTYSGIKALALCYVFDKPFDSLVHAPVIAEVEAKRKQGLASLLEPALTILASDFTL